MRQSLNSALFLFCTCLAAKLDLKAHLRHVRHANVVDRPPVKFDLYAFQNGAEIFRRESYAELSVGEDIVITEDILQGHADRDEVLFIAHAHSDIEQDNFFSQEHQISYYPQNPIGVRHIDLLYGVIPPASKSTGSSTFVSLIPKLWAGPETTSYAIFLNAFETEEPTRDPKPLELSVLDESGTVVLKRQYTPYFNSALIVDIGDELIKSGHQLNEVQFFNAIARGGSGRYIMFTIVRNKTSGAYAIEHSIPPRQYVQGDMQRIRAEGCRT